MNDLDTEEFDRLLGGLYDAVLAPEGFQHFLRDLALSFDLKGVALFVRHAQERAPMGLWLHGIESAWMESYALTYAREDMLARHIENSPIGQFYASNLDLPDPHRFGETRFFREWAQPQGIACAAASVVMREGLWITQVFLQRSPQQPPFARAEVEQLNRLLPHWQRATQMRQRLASLRAGQDLLAASLDAIAMPTLLFDDVGRVVHRNRSAGALLDSHASLWIEDDRLVCASVAATRDMHQQIGYAVHAQRDDAAPGVTTLERAGRQPLTMMVLPLRTPQAAHRSGALMFVFDPAAVPELATDIVRRLFDLTLAEAELAVSLCGGLSPEEAALERGRAVSTVRTQIRSLFAKTGTHRQADLVGLLLASPACFAARDPRDTLQ
jgi:DNA-binding CsgD family transcriptional regulator/PAS domain-containing protein